MLMGIVTKNAIMLVDFAVEAMHGARTHDRDHRSGSKRARPITMTTIAMVAGMAPSALAFGAGGEFRSPMAIAIIGGPRLDLAVAAFVPAFFTIMDDVGRLFSRVFGRLVEGLMIRHEARHHAATSGLHVARGGETRALKRFDHRPRS
jgi:hypothetical protein